MTHIKKFIKTQATKLVPFFVTVILYFVFVRDPVGAPSTTVLKCAPIVSLMVYLLLNGLKFTAEYKYSGCILLGLIFSCGGDVLLNIDLFPHGMGSFALAQICYILAFGFKPLKWIIALPLYIAGAALIAIIFKDLDDILVVGLPVYVFLLLTMCWRSIARAFGNPNFFTIFCAVGSIFFVISDALIGINMFLINIPFSRIWIMSTYYLAQFAIVLSTENDCLTKNLPKRLLNRRQMKIN